MCKWYSLAQAATILIMAFAANSQVVQLVARSIDYFETLAASTGGVTVDAVQKLTSQIAKHMQCVRSITLEDGLKMIQILSQMDKLDDQQLKIVSEIIDSKVKDAAASVADEKLLVTHWEDLQSKGDWDVYGGPHSDEFKLARMAARMKSVEVRRKGTDEKTFAAATVVALYKHGPQIPSFYLEKTRTLKTFVAAITKKVEGVSDVTYVADIGEFQRLNPAVYATAFAGDPHEPSRVDATLMELLKANKVCRSTRAGCDKSKTMQMPMVADRMCSPQLMQGYGAMMPPPMHGYGGGRSYRDPCPGMVYFDMPPPGAHRAATASMPPTMPPLHVPPPGALLALEGPAPQQQPSPESSPERPPTPLPPALLDGGGAAAAPTASAIVPAGTNVAADMKPLLSGFVDMWKKKAQEAGPCSKDAIKRAEPEAKVAVTLTDQKIKQKPAAAMRRPAGAMKRPAAAEHPDAPPKKSGNSAFDPTWFKDGPPRHFGNVTVYNDRQLQLYRIKPDKGSRHTKKVAWGKPDQHKEKWAHVIEWVNEYRNA